MNTHITQRAYFNWLNAGSPSGRDEEFYCDAERDLYDGMLTIYITEEDIKNGVVSCSGCPGALAVNRALGDNYEARVSRRYINIIRIYADGRMRHYNMFDAPFALSSFIVKFDAYHQSDTRWVPTPTKFRIEW